MNGLKADLAEVEAIRAAVVAGASGEAEVLVCPPTTLIAACADIARGSDLKVGGQNCHRNQSGAHTGSISPGMLVDAGATYVILGHSERRADHHEPNAAVKVKAASAKAVGLTSIVCVGETKDDRDVGRAHLVVRRQLQGSLPTDIDARQLVVAYEPIWAIGTGMTPSAEDIAEMHAFMRQEVLALIPNGGDTIRLLYGGSVKPSNAASLLAVENVDGALVGGASLKATDFMAIAGVYARALSTAG